KQFSLRIIKLCNVLTKSVAARAIASQLVRCGTSVGANYRAAGRARLRAEFIAKMGVVVEEIDETQYWLELLADAQIVRCEQLNSSMKESAKLAAIFTASFMTALPNK